MYGFKYFLPIQLSCPFTKCFKEIAFFLHWMLPLMCRFFLSFVLLHFALLIWVFGILSKRSWLDQCQRFLYFSLVVLQFLVICLSLSISAKEIYWDFYKSCTGLYGHFNNFNYSNYDHSLSCVFFSSRRTGIIDCKGNRLCNNKIANCLWFNFPFICVLKHFC